jgi:hypothetical protein
MFSAVGRQGWKLSSQLKVMPAIGGACRGRRFKVNFHKRGNIAAAADRPYVRMVTPYLGMPMPPLGSAAAGFSRPLLALVLFVALLVAAAVSLWAYYGTAVFFEIVRTGWVSCF